MSVLSSMVATLVVLTFPLLAKGHGYIREPPARNVNFESNNGNCPHCGNGNGICGDGNQWPGGSNYFAAVQEPQRTYTPGSVVQFEVSMNVNHKGHHEFFICDRPISSDTAEDIACLQNFPLMRATPEELGLSCSVNDLREDCQPIDANYPGRWYHPPGMSVHKISYRIPADLQCSHCTLQWFWPTANSKAYDVPSYSCYQKQLRSAGWNVFDFCGWACSADKCPVPYVVDASAPHAPDPEKTSGFEEFRNCADIAVQGGGSSPVPTPAEVPTPKPAPVASPTSAPTLAVPTPPPANSCPGEPCASTFHCRSKWGYCGSGSSYCNDGSTWKAGGCSREARPTLLPTPPPTSAPTLAVPTPPPANSCPGEPCASTSHCRSKWGYCGSGSSYCNDGSTWKAGGCSGEATPTLLPTPSPTEAPVPLPTAHPTPPLTSAPEPEPEPEPESENESEAASCIPIGNCANFNWCDFEAYSAWCRDAGRAGPCPSPFCTQQEAVGMTQLVSGRRLKIAKHQSKFAKDAMLYQRTLGFKQTCDHDEFSKEVDGKSFGEEARDEL